MKIVYIALLVLIITLPVIKVSFPSIGLAGYVIIVVSGVFVDLIDFSMRAISAIRRKPVPCAGMFVGFILMSIGIYGLTIGCSYLTLFEGSKWKSFLALTGVALLLHLFIHIILPLLFTMVCNLCYGRKLFDMNTLPIVNREH